MAEEIEHVGSVLDLMQHQSKIQPNATCMSKNGQSLTYEELNKASESIAALLVAKGAISGDIIPLITSRCLEMVACVLAIVRIGATWVPMEIETWGLERIQTVSARLDYKVALVTDLDPRGLQGAICLDQIHSAMKSKVTLGLARSTHASIAIPTATTQSNRSTDSIREARLQDIAYIIFTSGTTAAPKGVMVKHESLLNYVWPAHDESSMPFNLGVQPCDKVLLLFSVAFDGKYIRLVPHLSRSSG